MSPHEINGIRDELFPALERLGWNRFVETVHHERDSRTWEEAAWHANGDYLISEDDMGENLARELIRISKMVKS